MSISIDVPDPICFSKLLNSVSMLLVHLQELLPSKVGKTPKNYCKKRKRLLKAGPSDAARIPVAPSSWLWACFTSSSSLGKSAITTLKLNWSGIAKPTSLPEALGSLKFRYRAVVLYLDFEIILISTLFIWRLKLKTLQSVWTISRKKMTLT